MRAAEMHMGVSRDPAAVVCPPRGRPSRARCGTSASFDIGIVRSVSAQITKALASGTLALRPCVDNDRVAITRRRVCNRERAISTGRRWSRSGPARPRYPDVQIERIAAAALESFSTWAVAIDIAARQF
jgi:hypothetical protein